MRAIRGSEIAMIFQEPMTSLNPVYTVGSQIQEAILLHQTPDKKQSWDQAVDMLEQVGMPNPAADRELLPARAVRRHAAARHDRHGPVLPSRPADRR